MTLNWAERLAAIGLSADEALRKSTAMKGVKASAAWFVPGRIEFLGKHTDYAGGRSLICALERGFCVAAPARDDERMLITDAGRLDHVEFCISPASNPRAGHWSNYPMTVA